MMPRRLRFAICSAAGMRPDRKRAELCRFASSTGLTIDGPCSGLVAGPASVHFSLSDFNHPADVASRRNFTRRGTVCHSQKSVSGFSAGNDRDGGGGSDACLPAR